MRLTDLWFEVVSYINILHFVILGNFCEILKTEFTMTHFSKLPLNPVMWRKFHTTKLLKLLFKWKQKSWNEKNHENFYNKIENSLKLFFSLQWNFLWLTVSIDNLLWTLKKIRKSIENNNKISRKSWKIEKISRNQAFCGELNQNSPTHI